jgi:hypothetical protein
MNALDIPQANSLDRIRDVVAAIDAGEKAHPGIGKRTGLSSRHVAYHVQAGRVLGWVEGKNGELTVTSHAHKLLATVPGEPAERIQMRSAVERSAVVKAIAAQLLAHDSPTVDGLAGRILEVAELSQITARRRAQTLLSWRKRIVGEQLALPL